MATEGVAAMVDKVFGGGLGSGDEAVAVAGDGYGDVLSGRGKGAGACWDCADGCDFVMGRYCFGAGQGTDSRADFGYGADDVYGFGYGYGCGSGYPEEHR